MKQILVTIIICTLLGLTAGCTPPAQTSKPLLSKTEDQIPHAQVSNSQGLIQINSPGYNYQFKTLDKNWSLISDVHQNQAYLEFYNTPKTLRGEVHIVRHSVGEPIRLREKVQLEIQSFEGGSSVIDYSSLYGDTLHGISGYLWQVAGEKKNLKQQAIGFGGYNNGNYYFITVIHRGSVLDSSMLKDELMAFVKGFSLIEYQQGTNSEGQSWDSPLMKFESAVYGYTYQNSDDIWYKWSHLEEVNEDPDLALINREEDLSLFVFANHFEDHNLRPSDIFEVYLSRLGVDPAGKSMTLKKRIQSNNHLYEFSTVEIVEGFDFKYEGKFEWDGKRSIMVVTWTQNVLYEKYRKTMNQAIHAVKIGRDYTAQLSTRQNKFNGKVINHIGLLRLAADQPLVALTFFELANRMDPEEPLYLINCGFVYQLKNLHGPGTLHFEKQMVLVEKHGKLLGILGEMHEELLNYGKARQYYEQALQFYPNDAELVINLSDALWGLGQKTMSLKVVEDLWTKQPSTRLGVYLAKTHMGLDQYAEAVDLLNMVKQQFGITPEVGHALIDALLFMERYEEALNVNSEIVQIDGESSTTWLARGKSQFYLKQFREAEKSLSKALLADNHNEEAKSFHAAAKSFLGEADVAAIASMINPVLAKAPIQKLIRKEFSNQFNSGEYPAVIHHQEETLKMVKGTGWIRTQLLVLEIKDERGPGFFKEFNFTFLPGYDRIYVNSLEVYDARLNLKATAKVNQHYITSVIGDDNSQGAQMAHITIPSTQIGDFIYLQISRSSIEKTETIPFTQHQSGKTLPVAIDFFNLEADSSMAIWEEYGEIERRPYEKGLSWQVEAPVVIHKEMYMPDYRDFGSGLMIAHQQNWTKVAMDYQKLIKHQFKNSLSVREKAFEIKGSELDSETILYKIVDWVRDRIQYRDVAFGGHSLIPAIALETLNNRYGDCKDQSLLLKEMLDAVGIESHLALIHQTKLTSESLASIQQFNHMIVYVPATDKWPDLFFDPSEESGTRRPVPINLEGRYALILNSEKSKLLITPVLEKDQEHRVNIYHTLYINTKGDAEIRDSLAMFGKFGSGFRDEFLGKTEKKQQEFISEWLSQAIPSLTVTNSRLENVRDFSAPLILVVSYSSKQYFSATKNGLVGRFPNIWERSFMKLPRVKKRHHPIRLPHETHFISELIVQGPSGLDIQILPANGATPESFKYTEFKQETQSGKTSLLRNIWSTTSLYADPSEYEDIQVEWDFIRNATNPMIEIPLP
jgi:tetratricopeptide (TPR) repeat protein